MATHLLWETGINRFYRSSFIPFFLQLNEAWNEKRGIKAEIEVKTEVQNFETARVVSQNGTRQNLPFSKAGDWPLWNEYLLGPNRLKLKKIFLWVVARIIKCFWPVKQISYGVW